MSAESNGNIKKEILIDKIRAILYVESEKPVNEMDSDLVTECSDYLMELESKKRLTKEEKDSAVKKIMREYDKLHKRIPDLKKLLIAAIIAAILIIFGIGVIADTSGLLFNIPDWDNVLDSIDFGERVSVGDIELYKCVNGKNYGSVEEFLEDTELDILYPSKLPGKAEIVSVNIADSTNDSGNIDSDYSDIIFATNKKGLSLTVCTKPDFEWNFLTADYTKKETINNFECYLVDTESTIRCYFFNNSKVYNISVPNHDDLVYIINNLKENN